MNKLGTKTLKIILFIGVFAYLQYHDATRGAFSINSVTGGLIAASAAYLLASLFGIVLNLTRNYLLTIVGTAALALFLAFKLDDMVASISWLTEESVLYILGAFALLCLIRDIIIIKNSLCEPTEQANENSPNISSQNTDENIIMSSKTAQQLYKENPEWMLELSKRLEEHKGHKPTYEELIEYIDNEAFHISSDREIEEDIEATIKRARKNYKQKI